MLENIFVVIGIIILIILLSFFLLVAQSHKKVAQGKALIRTGFGGAKVALDSGMFVIPILHKYEEMDISMKTIKIKEWVTTRDEAQVEIETDFYVRVNKDPRDIVQVAQALGVAVSFSQEKIEILFRAKFEEAMKIVASEYDSNELWRNRERYKVGILETIGTDLNGYVLDDCAVHKIYKKPSNNLGTAVFVLLDENESLEKGEKVFIVDKINNGKSYLVRKIMS